MIQVNRIYLIFNRLVTKKFLVDTSEFNLEYNVLRLAGDLQLRVPVRDTDVPFLFNDVQILVERAENIENVLDTLGGNDSFHGFSCILHPVMAGEFLRRCAPRTRCAA